MTDEERGRFEAISDALARMVRRNAELEQRIARLEAAAGLAPEPPQSEAAPAAPVSERPAAPPAERPAAPPPARNLETSLGLTWISRIAVVTVALALAFFFEYAFENHWITEWGRVFLGLGAGAAALFFGDRFWRGGQRAYGQSLGAAGIAFLYLSFWAAFGLYHLVPQSAAFGLMALTTAGAGALALRYDSQAVALLGMAGGFATPLLLAGAQDAWFVLGYALLLDFGAAFAARARRWPWPEALALAGTLVLYVSQTPAPPDLRWAFTFFVLLYYGLFAASETAAVAAAAQTVAGIAAVELWTPGPEVLWIPLAMAAAGLAIADRRGWSSQAAASFAGFWLAYGAWAAQVSEPRPVGMPLAFCTPFYLLFLAWPVWRAERRRLPLGLLDLLLVVLNAGLYFGTCYFLLAPGFGAWEGLFAVAVAVVQMGSARLLWRYDARGAMLAAAAAWVLLVLAAPIQFAGYRITIAWALEGAAVAWLGVRMHDVRASLAAFAVFLLVTARLGWIDSRMFPNPAAVPLAMNARFLAFAVSAAALWACAWWIRHGPMAFGAYAGGHAVMLWGLSLEAVGWAARTATPENFVSAASMAISVLAGAYAVLLVAGGAARRSAITRMLGVGLIGLVILKLYLYDVWLLGQFYRMAAFAILGVLLLVMSYLYSRFRGSIENLWRS